MNRKRNIAVLAGGDSSEKVISYQSARFVAGQVARKGHAVWVVNMENGRWVAELPEGGQAPIDKNDFSFEREGRRQRFDGVLVAIHGTPGEDGKLQSYFELLGIPYAGCGVLASALTFNKFFCNRYLEAFGVRSAKARLVRRGQALDADELLGQVGLPCFVKPNQGGSSFGTSKVKAAHELSQALEKAFAEDDTVVVESFLDGPEMTCGVFRGRARQFALPITEIVSKREFFDFEAKYDPAMSEEITPARLAPELALDCQRQALAIAEALDCRGIVRVDFILHQGQFHLLEVNTVPGMTANSIVPKQAQAMGLDMADLFEYLIDELDD